MNRIGTRIRGRRRAANKVRVSSDNFQKEESIMKKFINLILLALIVFSAHSVSFADVKIKQKVTVEGQGMEQTRMIKSLFKF